MSENQIETGEVADVLAVPLNAPLDELLKAQEQLTAKIAHLQRAARADDLAAARELVRRHQFTAAELRCPAAPGAVEAIPSAAVAEGDKQPKKLPPKFRNPTNTAEMWSGRGLKPAWVVQALANGKSLDDLLIPADGPATEAQAEAETEDA